MFYLFMQVNASNRQGFEGVCVHMKGERKGNRKKERKERGGEVNM